MNVHKQMIIISILFFDAINGAHGTRRGLNGGSYTSNKQVAAFASNVKPLFPGKLNTHEQEAYIAHLNHNRKYRRKNISPLYGIKGFRAWFESAFPTSMVTVDAPVVQSQHTTNSQRRSRTPPVIDEKNKNSLPQIYDHVLIDANQYLHSTLRRAYNRNVKKRLQKESIDWNQGLDDETLDLSLAFFLRELDHLVTYIAIPRKSVVIALDGSPGAAKLDIQRRRRFGIYKKADTQRKQISILKERGWTDSDFGLSSSANLKGIENIIFAKHDREQISLNISPGTAYMDRVSQTILYWAWKSLSSRNWPVKSGDGKVSHQVKIYMSPSNMAGEGEVKLIDWLMRGNNSTNTGDHKSLVKMGESVAIVGGDSDLVLMGMVIPPSVTHNINILLPRELRKTSFYVASLWDATKMLAKYLIGEKIYGNLKQKPRKPASYDSINLGLMSHAKLDLVLLIIMHGNDYLPKIRGVVGGFDAFFTTYFRLSKSQLQKKNKNKSNAEFIVSIDDDNRLSINVPFALSFFKSMLKFEPPETMRIIEEGSDSSGYQLGVLHNLCDAKMLPYPLEFQTISKVDTSYFESELNQLNSKVQSKTMSGIKEVYGPDVEIVRMTMGKYQFEKSIDEVSKCHTTILGESDGHGVISRMIPDEKTKGRSYLFEVPHRRGGALQETKRRLACLALEEIFGKENMDLFQYDASDIDAEEEESEFSDEKADKSISGDIKSYLAGLLWTLETYQKGHCPDWGYNYGQRVAPAIFEIVEFLEDITTDGKTNLYRTDLIADTVMPPLPDGLTCLAALPPQAWHLVPEPYNLLSHAPNNFENIYNSCVDPITTVFDMTKFQKKCAASLKKIQKEHKLIATTDPNGKSHQGSSGNKSKRNIYAGSKYWTVVSRSKVPLQHPFTPPPPYTSRAYALRPNSRIKASKLAVTPGQSYRKSKLNGMFLRNNKPAEILDTAIH